ncbi:MAG: glycerol-3-phosphate acyltransferase [Chloroflexi bacterium]|nr:MAG: glycerol-3-phosphate acyltransferase [Chloroflexota bacterium]
MSAEFVLSAAAAYCCGAIPWSVWLARRFYGVDPRRYADGNPGAMNAFRAAGWRLGVLVIALDYLKGFLPVLVANYGLALPGHQRLWVAIAPTLGHAFSIFLRLRGGRALAVMFGVWSGLTLYEVPMFMGLIALISTRLVKQDELRSASLPVAVIIFLLVRGEPLWMVGVATAQLLVVSAKIGYYRFTQQIAGEREQLGV